jgi:hypothetical protein
MKSLFSKSISDACAIDDLTPETVRNHINNIFLSKIFDFHLTNKLINNYLRSNNDTNKCGKIFWIYFIKTNHK